MKININTNNNYNFSEFLSKEFVLFLKEEIKSIVADQKIAKRDRKDVNHPCPEKRVYSIYSAADKVLSNRETLNYLYGIYYFIRKNKNNVDWSKVSIQHNNWAYWIHIDASVLDYRTLGNGLDRSGRKLHDIVTKYVESNG